MMLLWLLLFVVVFVIVVVGFGFGVVPADVAAVVVVIDGVVSVVFTADLWLLVISVSFAAVTVDH